MKFLFRLFVFLLPIQLGYHFWPNWAHVFGIRVDYLSPTIFITDILLTVIVGLLFFKILKGKVRLKKRFLFIAVTVGLFSLINISLAKAPELAAVKWLKIWELIFLGYTVATLKDFNLRRWIVAPLTISAIIISVIGIVQVLLGRTIGGLFYYLGERSFNLSTPGIATINFFGKEFLRAYSTFSHPNALAGFLGVALLLCKDKTVKILGLICLLLTFSSGAIGALLLVVILKQVKKEKIFRRVTFAFFWIAIIASLVLPVISKEVIFRVGENNESIYKRLSLAETSGRIITMSPVYGVGLNNFITEAPKNDIRNRAVWGFQPVHNIFLLVFSETGIIGLILFVVLLHSALLRMMKTNKGLALVLLFIILTGVVDHYWFTLQQNQLIMAIVLGLSFRKLRE